MRFGRIFAKSENNNNDPWSKKRSDEQGPPDLDKIMRDMTNKFRRLFGKKPSLSSGDGGNGKSGAGILVTLVAVLITVLWVASGFFIVGPAEQGVVLQLGKYHDTVGPGLHWIPRFVQSKTLVNTQKAYAIQVSMDLLTKSSNQKDQAAGEINSATGIPGQVAGENTDSNSQANNDAAGDSQDINKIAARSLGGEDAQGVSKNVVTIDITEQYRIDNPRDYLFNIVDADQTLQDVTQSVLSEVVGTMQLDNVLTSGREALAQQVSDKVQALMTKMNSGITVMAVNVRRSQPPEQVADAFLEVTQAGQDEQRYIQKAKAYARKEVPLAEGKALRIKADAEAYQKQVVLRAQGKVASYNAILNVYKQSPKVTRERLYLNTMETVLQNTGKVLVDTKSSNPVFYLPVDQMMKNHGMSSSSKPRVLSTADQVTTPEQQISSSIKATPSSTNPYGFASGGYTSTGGNL